MSWFLRSWNQGTEPARTYCAVCFQCSVSSFRYTVCCDTAWSRDQHTSQHFPFKCWHLSVYLYLGWKTVWQCTYFFFSCPMFTFLYFRSNCPLTQEWQSCWYTVCSLITNLRQQCHSSKLVIFEEKCLNVLKCYTFLWLRWQNNCSLASSFTNCIMILYLLKNATANVSFHTSNSKMPNFELWHSCCKRVIYFQPSSQVFYSNMLWSHMHCPSMSCVTNPGT